MTLCNERTFVKDYHDHQIAVSLRCRSWGCPNCQDMRKNQLVAEGIAGDPKIFLTLTTRRTDKRTANEAAKLLSWGWRVARQRAMRKYKLVRLPFLAVIEAHESGWPHLHIMVRTEWIDWEWLSETMQELVDGQHVHIKRIYSKTKQAAYVAKYAGKAVHKFGTAKRYWQSQDYDLRPPEDDPKHDDDLRYWDMLGYNIKSFAERKQTIQWEITWVTAYKVMAHKDWFEIEGRAPPPGSEGGGGSLSPPRGPRGAPQQH